MTLELFAPTKILISWGLTLYYIQIWYSWGFAMVYKPIVTFNWVSIARTPLPGGQERKTERFLGSSCWLCFFWGVGKAFHMVYPLVNIQKLWKFTIFNGKTHYKWWFSIVMLVYQRVTPRSEKNPDFWMAKCWPCDTLIIIFFLKWRWLKICGRKKRV